MPTLNLSPSSLTPPTAKARPFAAAALFFLFLASTGPLVYKFARIQSYRRRAIALASISGVSGIGFIACVVLAVRRAMNPEHKEKAVAKWVLAEVRSFNITSFNVVKPNEVRILTQADLQKDLKIAAQFLRRKFEITTSAHSYFNEMREIAVLSKQEHRGNCLAKAMVAFDTLICRYPGAEIKFEIVSITNGDHYFIVIGRDPKSDIKNFRTWGSKAYVVDCWTEVCYPASEILTNLYDFSIREKDNNVILEAKPFDPTTQSFSLFLSNLHSSDEVGSLSHWQKQLLDEVHATPEISEKKIKASSLLFALDRRDIWELRANPALWSLQYQLQFLINHV